MSQFSPLIPRFNTSVEISRVQHAQQFCRVQRVDVAAFINVVVINSFVVFVPKNPERRRDQHFFICGGSAILNSRFCGLFQMLIRIQGPDGQKRVDVESTETTDILMAKIRIAYGYTDCEVYTTRDHKNRVPAGGRSLAQMGLKNGDLLYVRPVSDVAMSEEVTPSADGERIANIVSPSSSSYRFGVDIH